MKKFILYLHQLPQNIVALIILIFCKKEFVNDFSYPNIKIFYVKNFFHSGISLGNHIIVDYYYMGRDRTTIKHEYGHTRQSLYLGWLYLLVIGLPSFIGNIYDRLFHKKWDYEKRIKWYYNQPWEKGADKLGGVIR